MKWFTSRFFILFAILFLSRSGRLEAQGPQQMFYALNQNKYLLDMMPNATHSVAYSVRKLRANYTGFALRVRRTGGGGGSPQADVAFDENGVVSGSSIVTVAVSGGGFSTGAKVSLSTFFASSSFNGFISIWYDQSGNGNNAVQSTTSRQPQLVRSGALILENGLPSIEFVGAHTSEFLGLTSSVSLPSATLFGVCDVVAAPTTVAIADNGSYSYNVNTFSNTGFLGVTEYSVADAPSTLSYSAALNTYAWSKLSTNTFVEVDDRRSSSTAAINAPIAVSQIYGNALSTSTLHVSEFVITSYANSAVRSAVFENQRLAFNTL